ncbi:SgcJ/EcaC family oxidoreductase [Streptomyces sp. NPDC059193]|uniref:SgcJ/EcaC family oxidoreductase n=1 Tax=Streptomyces sp. NPDC059193 TaxID=3346763 RepID=UPI00367ED4ED
MNTTSQIPGPQNDATDPGLGTAPARRPRRRLKRAAGISALALAGLGGGGYLWLDATSDVRRVGEATCVGVTPTGASAETRSGDRDAVCGVLESLVDAWDHNDADAYGALFTKDATYTTFVGSHYEGRSDIVNAHQALFDGFLKDSKLADSFLGIRFLSADTAVVTGRGDTYTDDEPGELSKVQTYTLVREADGQWRIAAFHNTQRQSVMERISFILSPDTKPEAEK